MRMMIAVLGMACAEPPVEAPQELGDLGLYLFEHFPADDPREMEAGLANLVARLGEEDFRVAPEDRAFTMPTLTPEHLGGLSIPTGVSADDQVSVAISGLSRFPVEEQVRIMVDPVQTCLESEITQWAGRTFLTDPGCFEASTCRELETLTAVHRKLSVLLDLWYDQHKTYRRFLVERADGVEIEVIVGRAWNDEVFEGASGGTTMDQLFHLDVYAETDDETTLRWFSMWSSLSGLLIDNSQYANLVVDGLAEALRFGDEYLGGEESTCRHDRTAPKPKRPR